MLHNRLQSTLYNISMHIGTSTDAKTVAKDALKSFIKELHALGAILYHDDQQELTAYYTSPQNLFDEDAIQISLRKLTKLYMSTTNDTFYNQANDKSIYYHIFRLEGFGYLILLKDKSPLKDNIAHALEPICTKFANILTNSIEAQKNKENFVDFKSLINTMREGLALFDKDLCCIEINDAALEYFAYPYEEAIGKTIFSVIEPKDHRKLITLNQQENAKSEWTLLRKDGTTFPAFVSGSNIIYKGKDTRIVTFIDLTDVKEKDKQLYNQSRLAQMGEMISMIAHQWRQPLGAVSASIIGIKTKMQMQKFDLTTQDGRLAQEKYLMYKLAKMSTYIEHLSTTIEDFRNFFKPNKEKITVNLTDTIDKALNILHPAIIDHQITIKKDIYFNNAIETYSNEILQALLNILKNAIDHFETSQIKSPQIHIHGYIERDNFIIKICDNGGGIPKKLIDKIFDPYFSTKEDKNGTGLGLYMTKTMIEDHCSGKLEVANHNGGACFKIILN